MKIIICTIMRDRVQSLSRWKEQIEAVCAVGRSVRFSLSVYENDSADGTAEWLASAKFKGFENVFVKQENINTLSFGSVVDRQRVVNLAAARNECLDQVPDLSIFDYVLWIEPDVAYSPVDLMALVQAGNDWDILSGFSILQSRGRQLYDSWATRMRPESEEFELKNTTTVDDFKGVLAVWSTFNCVCLYRGRAFADGVRFGWNNPRFNKADCDTVVVCENFRQAGFNRIGIFCDFIVTHLLTQAEASVRLIELQHDLDRVYSSLPGRVYSGVRRAKRLRKEAKRFVRRIFERLPLKRGVQGPRQ